MKACRPRGQVFLAQNKLMEADGEFSIALDLAQRVGNPTQLWKTYVALGDLRQVQGREDDAHRVYRDALGHRRRRGWFDRRAAGEYVRQFVARAGDTQKGKKGVGFMSHWTLDKFSDDQQLDLVKYVVLWHHQSLNLFLKETIDDLG